jgi:hypothetical protein
MAQITSNTYPFCTTHVVVNSSEAQPGPVDESQIPFTKDLWKKISCATKKHLAENAFVFSKNLEEDYRYYDIPPHTCVIDFSTSIGHGKLAEIRLGQNLNTKEFWAFKTIRLNTDTIDEKHQEIIASKNLKRLKGFILDKQEKALYMAMELIDGVTLSVYDWEEHSGDLTHAIKLAISYLDELEFVAQSKVSQSDQNPGNIMIDLKKNKVFLIDFAGNGMFNHNTASFNPEFLFPCINIVDLLNVIALLPIPWMLEKKKILSEDYQRFYSSLVEIKSLDRNEKNSMYFDITISELKNKLSSFLQSL